VSAQISIVTPSYGQGGFIGRTIDSVLHQNSCNAEYRVVDGGSVDGTVEILRSFGSRLVWTSEADSGQAEAINKGFNVCKGEILGWLNADDVYLPGALTRVREEFQADPDLMLLYGDAAHVDFEGSLISAYPSAEFRLERLAYHCFICQPACFFRRQLWECAGGLNTKLQYALDLDLWIRFGLLQREHPHWKFKYVRQVIAHSRMHRDNKTISKRRECYQEIIEVIHTHFGIVPFNWVYGLNESAEGRFDGFFEVAPFSFSLLRKSAIQWMWLNRKGPGFVCLQLWRWLASPLDSLRRLFHRVGGNA
jgi:glycosyltransferase involved in cell wall biosynthesis